MSQSLCIGFDGARLQQCRAAEKGCRLAFDNDGAKQCAYGAVLALATRPAGAYGDEWTDYGGAEAQGGAPGAEGCAAALLERTRVARPGTTRASVADSAAAAECYGMRPTLKRCFEEHDGAGTLSAWGAEMSKCVRKG